MKNKQIKKLSLASILIAIAVVGGTLSFPVFVAKCAPAQHMVNVLSAILLGPFYALAIAFISSLLRFILGAGSLLAFPGSMFGAFFAGLLFRKFKHENFAFLGELLGTGIIGAICSYPISKFLMGSDVAVFAFAIPFTISSIGGVFLGFICLKTLKSSNILKFWLE